jgi:hypothetical protein
MALDLLVVAFALVFPGAAAIRVWDFVARIEDRSRESLYGFGAFIGGMPYILLQLDGRIDLRTLFAADGKLALNVVFATRTLVIFICATIALMIAAWALSRIAYSELGERIATRIWGRTLGGSNWAEVSSSALGRWIDVKTRDGLEWLGVLETIPDTGSGHLRLRWPEYYDADKCVWLSGNDSVILPVEDLAYVLILKEVTDDNGEERKQTSERGRQQTGEGADAAAVPPTITDPSDLAPGPVGDAPDEELQVKK